MMKEKTRSLCEVKDMNIGTVTVNLSNTYSLKAVLGKTGYMPGWKTYDEA